MLEWRWKLPASSRYSYFGESKRLDLRRNQAFHNASGGDKRDRTADLLNAIQALSQLSYTPVSKVYLSRSALKSQGFFSPDEQKNGGAPRSSEKPA